MTPACPSLEPADALYYRERQKKGVKKKGVRVGFSLEKPALTPFIG